jgi:hypothetical protein
LIAPGPVPTATMIFVPPSSTAPIIPPLLLV